MAEYIVTISRTASGITPPRSVAVVAATDAQAAEAAAEYIREEEAVVNSRHVGLNGLDGGRIDNPGALDHHPQSTGEAQS